MKRILLAFLLLTFATPNIYAGYKVQIKFTDIKDTLVYLAHYYGKPLPTIYKADSAMVDKKGMVTFQSKEPFLGGIYMILLSDKQHYFELLLSDGDNISITATIAALPESIKVSGSPENERFNAYVNFLIDYGKRSQALENKLKVAITRADTQAVYTQGRALGKELLDYRMNYIAKYPNTLLTNIFNAMRQPEVPEGPHYLPNGAVDSNFSYYYFKGHYWDYFNFKDDRLIHTPIYDQKLDEYFNKYLLPTPDSLEKEADMLLAKARGRKELFKYTLHWITQWANESKIMGLDEVFVYLVENYHMKGDAYWMDNETLNKYIDRARKIAPNVIGNIAPDIAIKGMDGSVKKLYDVKAKYTLLIFWSPDCGHCQQEMPKIDSAYKAVLKNKGVKIFALRTEGEEAHWKDFIKKNNMDEWIHVWDPEHTSNYQSQYDVYGTPVIYLLDDKKIIRGKKLDHENIVTLIDILETKAKNANNTNK
ncbi:MAG: DUF5106 domain-containing protein [Bacteroidetes bacterium]|nr:DUF5106 domain-containing protein [Bacteroidota bacterium]